MLLYIRGLPDLDQTDFGLRLDGASVKNGRLLAFKFAAICRSERAASSRVASAVSHSV